MTTVYPKIPTPGYTEPTYTATDPEILYSTARFTQIGVTIAGGQGILPAGTVLGRQTVDKKYYVYNNGASNGIQTARGVLRCAVDTGAAGAADQQGNLVISGIVKLSKVSGADAGALTDLGATTDAVLDTFKF
jgi:hypothetical protein